MFDMSWGEIMVIGGVALIVIGPKDLPKALRTVGQAAAKMRRLASEFHTQFNEAMREAELEDVKKEVAGLNQSVAAAASSAFNPIQSIRDEIRGAVEAKPAGASAEPDIWGTSPDPGTPDPTAPLPAAPEALPPAAMPVEEAGPIPRIEPVEAPDPVDPGVFGEAQPLRPEPLPPGGLPEPDLPPRREGVGP